MLNSLTSSQGHRFIYHGQFSKQDGSPLKKFFYSFYFYYFLTVRRRKEKREYSLKSSLETICEASYDV